MAVSAQLKAFRRDRASDLDRFARILSKIPNCNVGTIYQAVDQLKDFTFVPSAPNEALNYNYWGYNVSNIEFYFESTPRHTHPEGISNLSLSLDVKVVADFNDFKLIKDPYKHLEFNIVIKGNTYEDEKTKEFITSIHLDRHITSESDGEPEDVHPIYHLQFGGRKLEKEYRSFGDFLIMDSPRIVHYPMDVILGVDFILSNFFSGYWRQMRREGEFMNILREYQEFFWKPYAHSKASHWNQFDSSQIDWNPTFIWPQLVV